MRTLGNVIWFIFGGLEMGLAWWIAGVLCFITIIGIPFGKACFVIGKFSFFPFGHKAVDREEYSGQKDIGTGPLGAIGNIIWFLLLGLWLFLGHAIIALAFFITIIGIPFGIQHWKLAKISLFPIGKTVVPKT